MQMRNQFDLIGRESERAELMRALAAAHDGQGGVILLAGEAGIGKTHLAEVVLRDSGLRVINISLNQEATPPYEPIAATLRACLHDNPNTFAACGRLIEFLTLLLPEVGQASPGGGRAELFEAIRCAFQAIASDQPTAILLDDLQWADSATLELLPALAESFREQSLLLVCLYRNDEIPRVHPIRRLRTDLRRKGLLREIKLAALNQIETTDLTERVLGRLPGPSLAGIIYDHTQGVPFFIEELASALVNGGRVQVNDEIMELVGVGDLPIPDTVRDTILLSAQGLSDESRRTLEIAAVVGVSFEIDFVIFLAGSDAGLSEAIERRLIVETDINRAAFRHALTRDAIYSDIAWSRRRELHREVAARLENKNAPLSVIAEHWRAGHDLVRARQVLASSIEKSCTLYAYRDAALAAHQALELWQEGEDEDLRLEVLYRLGSCAQLNGDFAEAKQAWLQVVEGYRLRENWQRLAQAERALASVYELQGAWEQALAARRKAAEAYAQSQLTGEAAEERLTAAAHLRSAGRFHASLELLAKASEEARQVQRWDLSARIVGLEGNVRARMGEFDAGLTLVRNGLALALEHKQLGAAAEIYQRLADSLEHAGDYAGAKTTYDTAFDFCQTNGAPAMSQICLACLAVILRQSGEWERALRICHDVLDSKDSPLHARAVGYTVIGLVLALSGVEVNSKARLFLLDGIETSRRIELAACELLALWGFALVDQLHGDDGSATEQFRNLINRWRQVEDRHYAISPLRWAATHFGRLGASTDTHAVASALAVIASANGQPEALSALAHALGEAALLDGYAEQAVEQFTHSIDLLHNVEAPLERAETLLRLGIAFIAAGKRDLGLERIGDAYRSADKLKARPLANAAARELARQGGSVEKRLGRKASRRLVKGGLTRRELEVLGQIALGRTNREIAQMLFLSPRTVDMFVRNIFTKLDCHSRIEATVKAQSLGLLEQTAKLR
jgi:DNA-binding CsgD family transcriptional regulator/tetratricopeptide (TPR) repeat protein